MGRAKGAPASGPSRSRWHTALVALGSNLGDRRRHLERAVELVEGEGTEWQAMSPWRETDPVGGPPQGPYLNGVGRLRTRLGPHELLERLHAVEDQLLRERRVRFGARTIDLDLLIYDDQVIDEPDLTVPHPGMLDRGFVLEPLSDIAPEWRHPVSGRTFLEHWLEYRRGWKACE